MLEKSDHLSMYPFRDPPTEERGKGQPTNATQHPGAEARPALLEGGFGKERLVLLAMALALGPFHCPDALHPDNREPSQPGLGAPPQSPAPLSSGLSPTKEDSPVGRLRAGGRRVVGGK